MTNLPQDQSEEALIQGREIAEVVDLCRKIMLVEPLAAEFNSLPIESPVNRVMSVAKAMMIGAESNPALKQLVIDSGSMKALRDRVAKFQSGGLTLPEAFLPDLIRTPVQREA